MALPVPGILKLCNYLQNVVASTYIFGLQLSTFLFYNKHPLSTNVPPEGGCDIEKYFTQYQKSISIHAPHEGVRHRVGKLCELRAISIHAPHEGVRRKSAERTETADHFNPRTPRGDATPQPVGSLSDLDISIHAPHEGVRRPGQVWEHHPRHFNPRTPRGGATLCPDGHPPRRNISIHAPHEGVRPRLLGTA